MYHTGMKNKMNQNLSVFIQEFALPKYDAIPDVGLYLDQTAKYINGLFRSFPDLGLTGSMISNYVKRGLISNPVKKRYGRQQIARLIYITVVKNVLSMDHIALMFALQRETYPVQIAYDYFCRELENVLRYVFGAQDRLEQIGTEATEQKFLLRNAIISVAYKMYLDQYFAAMCRELPQQNAQPCTQQD